MSATDVLRRMLDERGVEWESKDVEGISGFHDTRWNAYDVRWCYVEFVGNNYTKLVPSSEFHCTPEQAIAATLGSERDEIYNAGFDNGVKACLQILDGYLDYPHSAVENISKWVDEQWKERES